MNPAIYLCLLLPIVLLLVMEEKQKKIHIKQRIIGSKVKKGNSYMLEIINAYVGKECLIYTMNSQITGTISEVNDNWIKIKSGTTEDIINLDYVIRIREYPKNKKGKKKSVVLD